MLFGGMSSRCIAVVVAMVVACTSACENSTNLGSIRDGGMDTAVSSDMPVSDLDVVDDMSIADHGDDGGVGPRPSFAIDSDNTPHFAFVSSDTIHVAAFR